MSDSESTGRLRRATSAPVDPLSEHIAVLIAVSKGLRAAYRRGCRYESAAALRPFEAARALPNARGANCEAGHLQPVTDGTIRACHPPDSNARALTATYLNARIASPACPVAAMPTRKTRQTRKQPRESFDNARKAQHTALLFGTESFLGGRRLPMVCALNMHPHHARFTSGFRPAKPLRPRTS